MIIYLCTSVKPVHYSLLNVGKVPSFDTSNVFTIPSTATSVTSIPCYPYLSNTDNIAKHIVHEHNSDLIYIKI